jgi:hypothetical protein
MQWRQQPHAGDRRTRLAAEVTISTVSAPVFSSRSQPNTAAPCAANSSATARPMPRAIPLISAAFPASLPINSVPPGRAPPRDHSR